MPCSVCARKDALPHVIFQDAWGGLRVEFMAHDAHGPYATGCAGACNSQIRNDETASNEQRNSDCGVDKHPNLQEQQVIGFSSR